MMDINKQKMLMKAFAISQFSYRPQFRGFIWIFHGRNTENRVNKIMKEL